MMTNLPITPGYNKHLSIKFTITKNSQRRATYFSRAMRWLPIPAAEADLFIAAGQATEYKPQADNAEVSEYCDVSSHHHY